MEAPVDLLREELEIDGMTCASCVARVEKALNALPEVRATVNLATERATVFAPSPFDFSAVQAAIASVGYSVRFEADRSGPDGEILLPLGGHSQVARLLRFRLLVSVVFGGPVIALSMISALRFSGWQGLALGASMPVVFWGAWPFHRAAALNLRHLATTMDTLVSLGIIASVGWSTVEVLAGGEETYLEVASGVTIFLLLGRYLEARAKTSSTSALRALSELAAGEVSVLRNGLESLVPIGELKVGELFVVRPGQKIATDGIVVSGCSNVDLSLLTGESLPIEVRAGQKVTGASMNVDGRLTVRASSIGAETTLAQIGRLIADAQAGKAEIQRLADRVSAVFVPVILVVSALTLFSWLWVDGLAAPSRGFAAAVAVLVIACPCALGLATPTALAVGTGRGAQLGILIKGPQAIEAIRRIDTVVFDKTGTLTDAVMSVRSIATNGLDELAALGLAASLETHSEHPIAAAIVRHAKEKSVAVVAVEDFVAHAGIGVSGTIDGRFVEILSPRSHPRFVAYVHPPFAVIPPTFVPGTKVVETTMGGGVIKEGPVDGVLEAVLNAESAGMSSVLLVVDREVKAVFAVGDSVRPSAPSAIQDLRDLGLKTIMLTGDNAGAAAAVANGVGIDQVVANLRPEDKLSIIRSLQAEGAQVAMVGDGVNDAAALAQADLGMAIGTGTDVAASASDITLMRDDLSVVADGVRLSRRTFSTIRSNLVWAFAYNIAAVPLAAFGLLNPMIAGAAMAFSSVAVVGNSLRLRRFN